MKRQCNNLYKQSSRFISLFLFIIVPQITRNNKYKKRFGEVLIYSFARFEALLHKHFNQCFPKLSAIISVTNFFTFLPNFRYNFFWSFPYNEVGPAEMLVRSLSIKHCSMRTRARKTAAPAASLQYVSNHSRFPQFAYLFQEEQLWTHRPDWKFRI